MDALFPFDREAISERVARKRGMTKEEVLALWEAKRKRSDEYHTVLGKLLTVIPASRAELGQDAVDSDPKFISEQFFELMTALSLDYAFSHKLVSTDEDRRLKIITPTLFRRHEEYTICDWKVRAKLWKRSLHGERALGDFSSVENSAFNKESARIGFCRKIVESQGVSVVDARIVHMDKVNGLMILDPSPEVLRCVDTFWNGLNTPSSSSSAFLASLSSQTAPYSLRPKLEKAQPHVAKEIPLGEPKKAQSHVTEETPPGKPKKMQTRVTKARPRDVMVDIETMSTENNAHILTIGAIKFQRKGALPSLGDMDTFYRRISFSSNEELEMHKSSDTIRWWMEQGEEAREEAFGGKDRSHLKNALSDFCEWFGGARFVWGHGATFDVIIINEALKRCGMEPPYKFWDIRDTRTAYDLRHVSLNKHRRSVQEKSENVHHHALDDCYVQISALKEAFE